MTIQQCDITKYQIFSEEFFFPIYVTFEDIREGEGEFTRVYGDKTNSLQFKDMQATCVMEHFMGMDDVELTQKLGCFDLMIIDEEFVPDIAVSQLLKNRRNKEIDKALARYIFNSLRYEKVSFKMSEVNFTRIVQIMDNMINIFGKNWMDHVPMKENPVAEHFLSMIQFIKSNLLTLNQQQAA
ncbi:hypothetical protein [Algicola sagamiensis]|uniref:hypothetical protein n=1 Tax=Algicola sagamiensis TaxID=163869 RepID=UPI00037A6331|nr:hypothetical protein [Algicola sagamiensis]